MVDKSILKKCRNLVDAADSVLISAGAGMSVPAGINYYDTQKFAELFPGLVKKGYKMQYELITHHAVNDRKGWTPAVKWGYLAPHINYVYYMIQKDTTYQRLYSLIKDKDYFVMTTNVDGLFVQNNFSKDRIYTPQGSFSRIQCMKACSDETWDVKPVIDKILPLINPTTQEVNDLSCIPSCPRCGGDMFMNVRGGSWFIDRPYELQKAALNKWINNTVDKRLVVLDIGTGSNTPGVVRWPAENIIMQHRSGTLIRINLYDSEVPKEIQNKSISINDDISEFMRGVFDIN
ncbi:MAG: NAD-dependent protein deacetylase of SIR2 family [Nitrospina sp.]|jgi:NAD-dependent SIR2 family protein deacetylase|nr:NAD-dependent protein deacetylase of SIR2 family [Nitrospina sp.]